MPRTNREIRRKQIMDIVVNLVAHEGLDALTVRRVAAEIGHYSTTVVTHYFSDKADLVHSFGILLADHAREEIKKFRNREPPDLIGFLISRTEVTDINIAWWRYFFFFWSRTLREPELSDQVNKWFEHSLQELGEFILSIYPDCKNAVDKAQRLTALMEGIAIRRHLDPNRWTAGEVRRVLEEEIALLVMGDSR